MMLDKLFGGELQPLSSSHASTFSPVCAARPAGVRHALSLLSWNLLAPPYKRPKETEAASRARASAQIEVDAGVVGASIGVGKSRRVHTPPIR